MLNGTWGSSNFSALIIFPRSFYVGCTIKPPRTKIDQRHHTVQLAIMSLSVESAIAACVKLHGEMNGELAEAVLQIVRTERAARASLERELLASSEALSDLRARRVLEQELSEFQVLLAAEDESRRAEEIAHSQETADKAALFDKSQAARDPLKSETMSSAHAHAEAICAKDLAIAELNKEVSVLRVSAANLQELERTRRYSYAVMERNRLLEGRGAVAEYHASAHLSAHSHAEMLCSEYAHAEAIRARDLLAIATLSNQVSDLRVSALQQAAEQAAERRTQMYQCEVAVAAYLPSAHPSDWRSMQP